MEKLKMHSPDGVDKNIEMIGKLFPNVLTERITGYEKLSDGTEKPIIERAIDFDILRQELSKSVVEGNEERYQFTWPDKKKSILLANSPIAATLRPCREESVNFDSTENLYIEGDNLDVLKLLQETYLGKVKMIYIDPPYNTGNDFVYEDDFAGDTDEFLLRDGQYDAQGNRMVQNTDSNGRFHTDWLNMIYPRLKVAKDLLTEDGVIFISIDDGEVSNITKICNEVYGESNFIADLVWANKEGGGSSDSKLFRIKHEHILCYAKNVEFVEIIGVPVGNEERYKSSDEYVLTRGKYYLQKMGMGTIQYSKSLDYPITTPDGSNVMPADNNGGRKACWRWSKKKYEWGLENGFIEIKKDNSGVWTIYSKQYLNCDNEGNIITRTQRPMGIIDEYSSTQAAKLLENMGLGSLFSYAKPIELIHYLCARVIKPEDIILDFFSGSATTAHAVMQRNAEDGGTRKFIMVQLPEACSEDGEAYKAGYKNICEIGKERIRRAGKKIYEQWSTGAGFDDGSGYGGGSGCGAGDLFGSGTGEPPKLDIGFRVLKLDSTNMKEIYYNPADFKQDMMDKVISNIEEDRTPEDLLFQVMLALGVLLSSKIEETTVAGKKVFNVANNFLIACFDAQITDDVVKAIAQKKPYYAVLRDSSLADDSVATNFDQIFATYSPDTVRRVL